MLKIIFYTLVNKLDNTVKEDRHLPVVIDLVDEESISKTKRHVARKIALILLKDNGIKPVQKLKERITRIEDIKPIYSGGYAKRYYIMLSHGDYAIQVSFVKNLWGKVKGFITVYNSRGEMIYRAKYDNGFVRKSVGNPVFAWIVRVVIDALKIPVKKLELGD